jgi:hypothetical protein
MVPRSFQSKPEKGDRRRALPLEGGTLRCNGIQTSVDCCFIERPAEKKSLPGRNAHGAARARRWYLGGLSLI